MNRRRLIVLLLIFVIALFLANQARAQGTQPELPEQFVHLLEGADGAFTFETSEGLLLDVFRGEQELFFLLDGYEATPIDFQASELEFLTAYDGELPIKDLGEGRYQYLPGFLILEICNPMSPRGDCLRMVGPFDGSYWYGLDELPPGSQDAVRQILAS